MNIYIIYIYTMGCNIYTHIYPYIYISIYISYIHIFGLIYMYRINDFTVFEHRDFLYTAAILNY